MKFLHNLIHWWKWADNEPVIIAVPEKKHEVRHMKRGDFLLLHMDKATPNGI